MFLNSPDRNPRRGPVTALALILMAVAAWTAPQAMAQLVPVELQSPGTKQLLIPDPNTASHETRMLGVLDIETYRESAAQAMYPWALETYIFASDENGHDWHIGRYDRFHAYDADGDGTDEVFVTNGSTEIAILENSTTSLDLVEEWTSGRMIEGPGGAWTLNWNNTTDRFTPADLDGNGDDEMIAFGSYSLDNLTWLGVMDWRGGQIRLLHRADVVGNRATIDGVPIQLGSRFYAMDLRGNGRDEIVARIALPSPSGAFELAVFGATRRDLVTIAYSDGPNIEALNDEPWYFGQDDTLRVIDVDGDGRDEILSVSRSSQRLGFIRLRDSDSQLVVFAQGQTQGGSLFVPGAGGAGDIVLPFDSHVTFHPVDVDGNGIDEIAYSSADSTTHRLGLLAFINGELRHVWSTPSSGIPGPHGPITLSSSAEIITGNFDASAREEIVLYWLYGDTPYIHVFRAGANGMVVSRSEDLGPVGEWTMTNTYMGPGRDYPEWTTPGQAQAFRNVSQRIVGIDDIRTQYVLDTATPDAWLAILVGLSKPAGIPQADWNRVRAQLRDELQALSRVITIFDRMQEINTYTQDALVADANHVQQMLRDALTTVPGGTGIDMSPLGWASQFVGVVGGALGNPATSSIQFMLTMIDGMTTSPQRFPLSPGLILEDYKIGLQADLVDVRQEIEERERVVRGDWGKLATFGLRYPGVEIGNLPGRSNPHTQELYQTVLIELYTINHSGGFLKGSSWDPTRFTPSYLTFDFDRTDPYAIRVGLVRKPAYHELIGFPSEAAMDDMEGDYSEIDFFWGRDPWLWEGGQYPALP